MIGISTGIQSRKDENGSEIGLKCGIDGKPAAPGGDARVILIGGAQGGKIVFGQSRRCEFEHRAFNDPAGLQEIVEPRERDGGHAHQRLEAASSACSDTSRASASRTGIMLVAKWRVPAASAPDPVRSDHKSAPCAVRDRRLLHGLARDRLEHGTATAGTAACARQLAPSISPCRTAPCHALRAPLVSGGLQISRF